MTPSTPSSAGGAIGRVADLLTAYCDGDQARLTELLVMPPDQAPVVVGYLLECLAQACSVDGSGRGEVTDKGMSALRSAIPGVLEDAVVAAADAAVAGTENGEPS